MFQIEDRFENESRMGANVRSGLIKEIYVEKKVSHDLREQLSATRLDLNESNASLAQITNVLRDVDSDHRMSQRSIAAVSFFANSSIASMTLDQYKEAFGVTKTTK